MSDLKRGDKCTITIEGNFLNYCCDDENGNPLGARFTDKKRPSFWFIVPLYAVTKND